MKRLKILYAVQRTGNGHIARAQELIPIIENYAHVDILASGSQAERQLTKSLKFSFPGISLFYGKNGSLSYRKLIFKNNFFQFLKTIFQSNFSEYDLIINDFEPITAWYCKFHNTPIISLSHQSSLWFAETPKPDKNDFIASIILVFYAPIKEKYGFHFKKYNSRIFTPVIRSKIRNLHPTISEKHVVYLPAFTDEKIFSTLNDIDTFWVVFSKNAKGKYQNGNCTFYPINENEFITELESCKGVLCGAGFELPSEALFLKKKLFVIPIKLQLEQEYNAKSLELLGVAVSSKLDKNKIKNWVHSEQNIKVDYPDESEEIIKRILNLL